MILVVGLGNPGEKYSQTRHNVGFMVVDNFLKKKTALQDSNWELNKKFNCWLAKVGEETVLAKPMSFMNASGEVVKKLLDFFKISSFGLYVIHDELDLPLGKIKISWGHGAAGHKGVQSIIEKVGGNNFARIRVGIGSDKRVSNSEKYVLSAFEENEIGKLNRVIKKASEALEIALEEGIEKAASLYNA